VSDAHVGCARRSLVDRTRCPPRRPPDLPWWRSMSRPPGARCSPKRHAPKAGISPHRCQPQPRHEVRLCESVRGALVGRASRREACAFRIAVESGEPPFPPSRSSGTLGSRPASSAPPVPPRRFRQPGAGGVDQGGRLGWAERTATQARDSGNGPPGARAIHCRHPPAAETLPSRLWSTPRGSRCLRSEKRKPDGATQRRAPSVQPAQLL